MLEGLRCTGQKDAALPAFICEIWQQTNVAPCSIFLDLRDSWTSHLCLGYLVGDAILNGKSQPAGASMALWCQVAVHKVHKLETSKKSQQGHRACHLAYGQRILCWLRDRLSLLAHHPPQPASHHTQHHPLPSFSMLECQRALLCFLLVLLLVQGISHA